MSEDRVGDLLSLYLAGRDAGRAPTLEELCRDCPELLSELRSRVIAVEGMDRLVQKANRPGTKSPHPTTADFPRQLGGYAVREMLGYGGMGAVLLADDATLGRQVAVKVMLPRLATDDMARERFLREARAAAAIQHDHVVPIHHVGEESGVPYLVMPLLQGEPLDDRLKREGMLCPSEVARIGREAAEGLAAAHAKRVIHRDVKPANLWLEVPNGRVKVLDFGLARQETGVDGVTRSGALLGSPAFMSPEQADGQEVDARTDLFSLGATLYQVATGVVAFHRPTLTAVLRAVADYDPPPPCEVNPAVPVILSDYIMRLLAKKPEDRPQNAVVVMNELAAMGLSGTPVQSETVDYIPKRRSGVRRKAVFAGGLLCLLLMLPVACLATGPWRTEKESEGRTGGVADLPDANKPTGASQDSQSPTRQPERFRGSVDLLVYRINEKGSDVLVPLSDPLAMPLRKGDHFRINAEVEPASYLYLFWVDENGVGWPMYPWVPGEWGTRPAVEEKVTSKSIVAPNGNGFEITGDGKGMETIVMLARAEKLNVSDEKMRTWFTDLKPLPFRGPEARVWFENFDVVRTDQKRGFKINGNVNAPDGPVGLQKVLEQRIGKQAEFSRAISFARVGSNK